MPCFQYETNKQIKQQLNQRMKKFIFLFVLFSLSAALIFEWHVPLISAPKPKKSEADLLKTANKTRYLLFMKDINSIKNVQGFISRTLQLSFRAKYPDLEKLFTQIQVGIRAVRKGLIKYNLLVNSKENFCPKPHTFNEAAVDRYLKYATQKVTQASAFINKTSALNGLQKQSDKMLNLTKRYVHHVKATMAGNFCSKSIPSVSKPPPKHDNITYKNNLHVSNWYYGSSSKTKYQSYLLAREKNFNLTLCPEKTPFVRDDEQICFNCEGNSIYNLGKEKCQSCKPGEMLNIEKNSCEPCYGDIIIFNHHFICKTCAIEALQYYDPVTKKCKQCDVKEYLDDKVRKCKPINCPKEKPRYDREVNECKPCPKNEIIDPVNPTLCKSVIDQKQNQKEVKKVIILKKK